VSVADAASWSRGNLENARILTEIIRSIAAHNCNFDSIVDNICYSIGAALEIEGAFIESRLGKFVSTA
jgi:hypothetical protein